jgi:hypothetical protein
MSTTQHIRILGVMLLVALGSAGALSQKGDVRILQSDRTGAVVEFLPVYSDTGTIAGEGQQFVRYTFRGGVPQDGQPEGAPQTFFKPVLLRFPGVHNNTVEILAAEYQDLAGKLLAPVPELRKGEYALVPRYAAKESRYSVMEFLPGTLVSVENVGESRGVFLGQLRLFPLQYNPASRVLRRYSRIVARVNFGGPENTLMAAPPGASPALNDGAFPGGGVPRARKAALANSVLASGPWFRFTVGESGMYMLTGQTLLAAGVPSSADPGTIRIYGNGGFETPLPPLAPAVDDLMENAVYVTDGGTQGQLDPSDQIVFYGRNTREWSYDPVSKSFSHYINRFAEADVYWLTYGGGPSRKMQEVPSLNTPSALRPGTVLGKIFREDEKVNILASGPDWLGQMFNSGDAMTYVHPLPGLDVSQSIHYKFNIGSCSSGNSRFTVGEHSTQIASVGLGGTDVGGYGSSQFINAILTADQVPNFSDGLSQLRFTYTSSSSSGNGYIDWYEILYHRFLAAQNDRFGFTTQDTSGIAEYSMTGFSGGPVVVFDVTRFDSARIVTSPFISADTCRFQVQLTAGSPREIAAVGPGGWLIPGPLVSVPNQNLHGDPAEAASIIITHQDFMSAAQRLKAYREQPGINSLTTIVVDVQQIYNEFGGGMLTPAAIRNYLRYVSANWSLPPRYVLLFGDGDYDFKRILGESSPNWLPPWEKPGSFVPYYTFPWDDAFGIFTGSDRVNLGIGRLTVRSLQEATTVVDKIIEYEQHGVADPWKLRFTFVADDGPQAPGVNDGMIHTQQADGIAGMVPLLFEKRKIYLYEYPTVYAAGGRRKPEVNAAIRNQINQGTLILNFTGHGNPRLWTHEAVFVRETDFPLLGNKGKYFFLVAATCNYSDFDMVDEQSGGEILVSMPQAGAIGTFSATGPVFAPNNYDLNVTLYENLFQEDSTGRVLPQRLGDIVYRTKQIRNDPNSQKYFLIGDPALVISFPRFMATVDSINGVPASQTTQLKALERATIAASVRDTATGGFTPFTGSAQVVVYDANRSVTLTDPDTHASYTYSASGSALFRGDESITGGLLNARFIVPKDISYSNDFGRITMYFWNSSTDGAGYTTNIRIGGTDTTSPGDTRGPAISLFIDSRGFRPGDVVSASPLFIADLRDSSGINTSGAGVGHRLEAWLDDNAESIDLSEYYKSKKDSFTAGTVEYPLGTLAEGTHKIRLRAWDTYNNPSTGETVFDVMTGMGLQLVNVFNYPNPFSSSTIFMFEHNQVTGIDAEVRVYTVAGRLIQTLRQTNTLGTVVKIPWDGLDKDGDRPANGIYLYKVSAKTSDGRFSSEAFGKLSIIR